MKASKKYSLLGIGLLIISISCCKEDDPITNNNYEYDPDTISIVVPPFYPVPEMPADNPCTEQGVYLGRLLFYDNILSGDQTMSCSSCHLPANGFSDGKAVSTGIDGIAGNRSSMPLVNLAYMFDGMFWDGRAETLEEQILGPVPNPIELHLDWQTAVDRLSASELYKEKFYNAFGNQPITKELVAKAVAQFLRTMISFDAKYDYATRPGTGIQFTELEEEGRYLFFTENGLPSDAQCFHCHGGRLFTDNKYHNNGLTAASSIADFPDKGRGEFTNSNIDAGRFKTPTLRNLAFTAPYMHDGRFATLEEVIDHYSHGIENSPTLDPLVGSSYTTGGELNFTAQQKAALIAFLNTLNDSTFIQNPAFQAP